MHPDPPSAAFLLVEIPTFVVVHAGASKVDLVMKVDRGATGILKALTRGYVPTNALC